MRKQERIMKHETINYGSLPILVPAELMSKISGIGENTLRRLMDLSEIDYLQIGRRRLLHVEAVLDYYHRHKTSAKA